MFTKLLFSISTLILILNFSCTCTYVVNGSELANSLSQSMVLQRPIHTFPRVGKYEVLLGDFHLHTTVSDGKASPEERVLEAWKYGYDVIAITDHSISRTSPVTKGYLDALPLGKSLGLIMIPGLESGMRSKEHILVLGIPSDWTDVDGHGWMEDKHHQAYYQNEMQRIAKNGGILVYAHPHVGLREPVQWAIDNGYLVGIEVKNQYVSSDESFKVTQFNDIWCYPFAFDWALENNLAIFANSDWHSSSRGSENPFTLVFVEERTEKGVMDAIRSRRTAAWFDGMLWGREQLLSELVHSMIDVQRTGNEGWLTIKNRGLVPLKANIQTGEIPRDSFKIGSYGEALIQCSIKTRAVRIQWENIWVNPNKNLSTIHDLQ